MRSEFPMKRNDRWHHSDEGRNAHDMTSFTAGLNEGNSGFEVFAGCTRSADYECALRFNRVTTRPNPHNANSREQRAAFYGVIGEHNHAVALGERARLKRIAYRGR